MPRKTVVPTLCLILFASVAALAGEKAEKKDPPTPPKPAKVEDPLFELKDGNRFRGQIELESLEVDTEFGTQKIPRARLVRILFGLSSDPDYLKRLETLIEQLGDSDFEKREKAQEEILAMGLPAKEAVAEAMKHKDPEVKSRAEAILKVFLDFPGEAPTKEDKVETPSMTLTGRVKLTSFPVRTAYGALQIPRKAIQSIDFRGAPRMKEFSVAATAQGPQKLLNTGVRLKAGQKIKIKASGSVMLRNYGQPSNPDGLPQNSYGLWNNVPQGALFGRLGADGPIFKIGSDYDEAPGTGILQLGIAGSSPHPMDSGSYKVSIEVIPELSGSDEKPSDGKAPADADK
jgi:hypothetical protein